MLDRGCSMKCDLERCVKAFEDPLKMLADDEPTARPKSLPTSGHPQTRICEKVSLRSILKYLSPLQQQTC